MDVIGLWGSDERRDLVTRQEAHFTATSGGNNGAAQLLASTRNGDEMMRWVSRNVLRETVSPRLRSFSEARPPRPPACARIHTENSQVRNTDAHPTPSNLLDCFSCIVRPISGPCAPAGPLFASQNCEHFAASFRARAKRVQTTDARPQPRNGPCAHTLHRIPEKSGINQPAA